MILTCLRFHIQYLSFFSPTPTPLPLSLSPGSIPSIAVFPPEYLNRFRSVFTSILMVWTVKNDIDADLFNLDRKAIRGVVSIQIFKKMYMLWKVTRIRVIRIGNGLDIQVWTRLLTDQIYFPFSFRSSRFASHKYTTQDELIKSCFHCEWSAHSIPLGYGGSIYLLTTMILMKRTI